MENELNNPIFPNTPQSPPKWLVILWGLSMVMAIVTEVVRYEKKTKEETIQTEDVGLSDTHHQSDKEQKTQIKTARKD